MITVVICAYTESRWTQLERAVASVERQDPSPEVVIVVDHNEQLLSRARQRWPGLVVVPNSNTRGLAGARNSGVVISRGEIIAFLDDDAFAHRSWLRSLTAPFDDPTVGGTGGLVVADFEQTAPSWFPKEYLWVVGCSYSGQPTQPQAIRNPIGANMAFRRRTFADVGGFLEGIGRVGAVPLGCEETELAIRAAQKGYTIWYEPRAVVEHSVPPSRLTRRYFLRRSFAEGVSKAGVASAAGTRASLQSETTYVVRVLTRGVVTAVVDVVRGPDRVGAAGRAVAIVAGATAASIGFAVGKIRRPRLPAPRPMFSSPTADSAEPVCDRSAT